MTEALTAPHVVLLGDSIFDNGVYVPGEPDVVTQLHAILPQGWRATLAARDGSVTGDVARQAATVPADATHLVVSAGGNDALGQIDLLRESAASVAEVLSRFASIKRAFQQEYRAMIEAILAHGKPTAVCTIYDSNFDDPTVREIANVGLSVFNDVITREACAQGIPFIDLRVIFTAKEDYANAIEPSARGGDKLARVIAMFLSEQTGASYRPQAGQHSRT